MQNINLLDLLFVFATSLAGIGVIIYEVVKMYTPARIEQIMCVNTVYRNPQNAVTLKSQYMLASEYEFNHQYRPISFERFADNCTKQNEQRLLDDVRKSGLIKTKVYEQYPGDREKIISSSIIIIPQHD